MKRKDDIAKVLDPWLAKAQKNSDPPKPRDARGSLQRIEHASGGDALTQLNFKITRNEKNASNTCRA